MATQIKEGKPMSENKLKRIKAYLNSSEPGPHFEAYGGEAMKKHLNAIR